VPHGAGLTRLHFRNRAPVLSGSTVVCSGVVAAVSPDRSVTIDLEIRVDGEVVVAPAGAVVRLEPVSGPRARLHHTHLFASDLEASLDFYRRWFGAEVLGDEVLAGARNVLVSIGDGRLNFYDQPPRDRGRNAVHHLGIQTDDLEGLVERMRAGGVAFRKPITRDGDLGYVMVEGPDGVLIELFEAAGSDYTGGTGRWFDW
ncbi:MAG: VOC family protein, partial [Acidimicrobiales bacterium]